MAAIGIDVVVGIDLRLVIEIVVTQFTLQRCFMPR